MNNNMKEDEVGKLDVKEKQWGSFKQGRWAENIPEY